MAQKRFYNWEDEDWTDWLNRRDIGILPYGLYRGFDANLVAGLLLDLVHTQTGYDEVDQALSIQGNLGLVKTKQGVLVIEDAAVTVPIASNLDVIPRIDVIVLEHQYVQVNGGVQAIYRVIQGTPSSNPAAPAIPDPPKQVILGYLFCPPGMTSLTDPGVVYTKADNPFFAGDNTIMRTHLNQRSTGSKKFDLLTFNDSKEVIYNAGNKTLDFQNQKSNQYHIAGGVNDYVEVHNIVNCPPQGQGYYFRLYCAQRIRFVRSTSIPVTHNVTFAPTLAGVSELRVDTGEFLEVYDFNGFPGGPVLPFYFIMRAGEAKRYDYNKFRRMQSFTKGIAPAVAGIYNMDTNRLGNLYELNFGLFASFNSIIAHGTGDDITALPTPPEYTAGTFFWVKFKSLISDIIVPIVHNTPGLPSGYKPIFTPHGQNINVQDGDLACFMEFEDRYEIVSYIGPQMNPWELSKRTYNTDWKNIGAGGSLETIGGNLVNGSVLTIPTFTPPTANVSGGNYVPARIRKLANGMVEMDGVIQTSATNTDGIAQALFTLPSGGLGWRPSKDLIRNAVWNESTGPLWTDVVKQWPCYILIKTDGTVEFKVRGFEHTGLITRTGWLSISCMFDPS